MKHLTSTPALAACVAVLILWEQELPNEDSTLDDFVTRFHRICDEYFLPEEVPKLRSDMRALFRSFGSHAPPLLRVKRTTSGRELVEFFSASSPATLLGLAQRAARDSDKGLRWEAITMLAYALARGVDVHSKTATATSSADALDRAFGDFLTGRLRSHS